VIENKKLVQDWYCGKWKEPSKVTFTLTKKGKGTVLEFFQENVPDGEAKGVDSGWDDFYFAPMKEFLEDNA
jgi:activator of HSP90 ATPase